jgi:hypothetical protein
LTELRQTLVKVGSNPFLRGKKIEFEILKPYKIISKFKPLGAMKTKNPGTKPGLKVREKWRTSLLAERVGFEPTLPCGKHAFQACAFGHSATFPC